jgi:putative restriction endonuclease
MSHIEHVFLSIKTWKRNSEVALHKPLLLLYALWQYRQGHERLIPYKKADHDLVVIVQQLQIMSRPFRTYYPFWRLQSDDIWEVEGTELIRVSSQGDAWKTDLEHYNVKGGLTTFIYAAMQSDHQLSRSVSESILQRFFAIGDRDRLRRYFSINSTSAVATQPEASQA